MKKVRIKLGFEELVGSDYGKEGKKGWNKMYLLPKLDMKVSLFLFLV